VAPIADLEIISGQPSAPALGFFVEWPVLFLPVAYFGQYSTVIENK
jgi:hypothetical protein